MAGAGRSLYDSPSVHAGRRSQSAAEEQERDGHCIGKGCSSSVPSTGRPPYRGGRGVAGVAPPATSWRDFEGAGRSPGDRLRRDGTSPERGGRAGAGRSPGCPLIASRSVTLSFSHARARALSLSLSLSLSLTHTHTHTPVSAMLLSCSTLPAVSNTPPLPSLTPIRPGREEERAQSDSPSA